VRLRNRLPFGASRDRWLVSYADLVTILLACFATTYAASRSPHAAAATVKPVEQASAEAPRASARETTRPYLREFVEPIVAASGSRQIALVDDARGVVISLPESASFATGSAVLTMPARAFLRELAASLKSTGATMRIEGHTDDVPVAGGLYTSNWELSTARASAVVAFLIDKATFPPERLSAAGYGEFHPRVANDSPGNRALNRRVDVVLTDARPQ
jgi:chemotaxis protein MotB